MAGMFYSLKEAAEKLGITAEKIEELVKEGRLREFSDGPNVLYKVDEVEALMSDTGIMSSKVDAQDEQESQMNLEQDDEISLAPDSPGEFPIGSELTDADTAIASEGINILGDETDKSEYQLTEDTLAETRSGKTGGSSLEEIDDSVNLDTFGSGSGLLDLSLQADDTSLGGILDEIYTPEGEEEGATPPEASAMDMAVEAEQMLAEEGLGAAQVGLEGPVTAAYAELPADTSSNIFGVMLVLPLLLIIYSAIVVLADFANIVPVVREKVQGFIWYIMIGFAVLAGVLTIAGFMAGGTKSAKPKKVKKPKQPKEKKPKPQKEKKPKKKKK